MPSMPSATPRRRASRSDDTRAVGRDGLSRAVDQLDVESGLWLNVAIRTAAMMAEMTAITAITDRGVDDERVGEVNQSLQTVFGTAWSAVGDAIVNMYEENPAQPDAE